MRKTVLCVMLGSVFVLFSCSQQQKNEKESVIVSREKSEKVEFKDFGAEPFVFDIEAYTVQNENYRSTIWTGTYMQMTVMAIPPGEDIGLELHTDIDQFIRVEEGSGIIKMGDSEDNLNFEKRIEEDFAVFIPAGKWHNLVNDTDKTLKIYSIYSPVEHPKGTVHPTKAEGGEPHVH